MARAIAEHWSKFVLTSLEKCDTWAQVVVVNGFTDVELISASSKRRSRTTELYDWRGGPALH